MLISRQKVFLHITLVMASVCELFKVTVSSHMRSHKLQPIGDGTITGQNDIIVGGGFVFCFFGTRQLMTYHW